MPRRKFRVGTLAFLVGMLAGTACGATRLLYWNIQDGMWDGQTDNFNRFVGWVQKQSPDICVFAEVKTRKNARFAEAREFVTPAKQRRVLLAAQLWLQRNPTQKQPRFDVIEVYGAEGAQPELIHIENAFEL